jgi:hypothetical protein
VVRNTTCPGPCQSPPPPAPRYTGDGLVVRVRSAATHEIVAHATPKDGRFHFDVGPGLYVVHAHVEGKCWKGSRRRAGIVDRGAWVRLTVHNECVV